MRAKLILLMLFAGAMNSTLAWAQPTANESAEIARLTAASGCDLCHALAPRASVANEVPPIGPAWQQIAQRCRGKKDAVDRLTATILQGSGTRPGDRHWGRQASGVAMPSNTVEISAQDAGRVVRWILSLQK